MNETPKDIIQKAIVLESQGDDFRSRQNWEAAFEAYQASEEFNPNNPQIYDKLIEMKSALTQEWKEADFTQTLSWTMKKQELENPNIKNLHETLSVEYGQIKQLIAQLLLSPEEFKELLLHKIKAHGEKAVLPLLHTLLEIDAMAREQNGESLLDATLPPPPPFSSGEEE
ncbi:MAG: hypothetical protein HQM15_01680 [Deltaproteobacteria bacterium]|nr:hypothetical protein [Deltaproteobacteria bacterium]